jgi:hypothetical protein
MSDADRPPALADAPPIYLDNVTRYTGARAHLKGTVRLRNSIRGAGDGGP